MTRIIIFLLFLSCALIADVKSTTGQIKFDTQMDNQAEMTLNATGLGIGTTPSSNLHVAGNTVISRSLSIGGTSGSSNLNINGTIGFGFETVSENTILSSNSIVLVDSSSDNIIITLPYAGNVTGRHYTIKKISTEHSVWLSGGGNLIDTARCIEFLSGEHSYCSVLSNGSQWLITNSSTHSLGVAADNLIGWWKMDAMAGGNLLVDELNLYPANPFIESSHADSAATVSATGLFDQAIEFDGDKDTNVLSCLMKMLIL